MLPKIELNVYVPFAPRSLIADAVTLTGRNDLAFIARDTRPIRVRFLGDDGQGRPQFLDLGSDINIALAGRAASGMGPEDPLIYLLNDFTREEVQDNESNIVDVYYEGILDTNTTEAIEALGSESDIPTWTEIEISNADFSRRATVLRMNSTLKLDVYRGTEGAPDSADPNFLNEEQTKSLLTNGSIDAVFASLALSKPGLHAMDEAVAQLDDAGTLDVPSPGKGNILLVRRQADPTGADEITAFTGLQPGAMYWLVHDDGDTADAITFRGVSIRHLGRPIPVLATSATAAYIPSPDSLRLAWGGDSAETTEDRYLKANGVADGGVNTSSTAASSWHFLGRSAVATKLSLIRTSGGGNDDFTVRVYVVDDPAGSSTQVAAVTATDFVDLTTAELDVTIEAGMLLGVSIEGTGTAPGPSFVTLDLEY